MTVLFIQGEVEDVVKEVEVVFAIFIFVEFHLIDLVVGANEDIQDIEVVVEGSQADIRVAVGS